MAINQDILNQSWEEKLKGEVEDALKILLTNIIQEIADKGIPQGGITVDLLSSTLANLINNAVPNTRTVNAKQLSQNITLGAGDVGAVPASAVTESLSETGSGKVLDARAGKTLKDLIDGLQATLNTITEDGNVQNAIDTFNEVVAFLNGISSSDTLAAKLAQIQQSIPSVDGFVTEGDVEGMIEDAIEDIPAGADGITPHIGSNGNWWIGPETDQNNDTNVPAQGPMGSVTITEGNIDTLEVHNALNAYTGLLGMSGAMKLKSNIDAVQAKLVKLYNKLDNMAFWDATDQAAAQPTALDWSLPKHSVAITNNLANSSITRDGEPVGNSFQAEEGSTVTLIVAPASSSYALTNVSYVKDSDSSASATSLGDGTYKIEFVMGDSDVTISVSGTVVALIPITYGTPTHCAVPSGFTNPTSVASGDSATIKYECDEGYVLTTDDITISGATIGIITNSGNVFTIPITHNGTSQSISISAVASALPIKLLKGYYIGTDVKLNSLPAAVTNAAVGNGSTVEINKVVLTDYIHISGNSNSSLQNYAVNCGVARGSQKDSQQGPPSVGSFFRKTNGAYKLITSWGWPTDTNNRTVTPTNFNSSGYGTEILNALQAGELYVRVALYLGNVNPDELVNSCSIQWGGDTLFSALSNYTITTDTTEFDPFTYDGAPQ